MKDEDFKAAKDLTKIALEQPLEIDSDIKGVIKEINLDVLEADTKLPSIDMKTVLHKFEVSAMVVHDTVINLNCLPKECLITTRIKKRLAVSQNGRGREDVVRIIQGERDHKKSDATMNKLKSLVTPSQ